MDITRTMGLPTLKPAQSPPETATALSVVHHPDGTCRVYLGLEQVDKRFKDTRERVAWECTEERLRPTVWGKGTVTSTIMASCDGCQYVRGGTMTTTCPRDVTASVVPGRKTVTVEEVRTRWIYECEMGVLRDDFGK